MSPKKVLILSGAGLSAESGIPTFRDEEGLWERYDVMRVCSLEGWQADRPFVTEFYDDRREALASKKPNAAHYALTTLEQRYPGRIIHLTQNVDDLCERAGSREIIHLHGTLTELRCESCRHVWDVGYARQNEETRCPSCGSSRVRHNVVMFGESAPAYRFLYPAAAEAGLFIAIGTSGRVIDIVDLARTVGNSLLIDPVRREHVTSFGSFGQNVDEFFTRYLQKTAVEAADALIESVEAYLKS